MDIESFNRRSKMLALREQLLSVEEARLHGNTGTSIADLDQYLDIVIQDRYFQKEYRFLQVNLFHITSTIN